MDSQYLMRRKCITSCFVYQSFSICLVNRFNLIQTVGGKINWNCNGGHDGQDAVCFSAFHFQRANLAIPLIEYWHKIVCSGLKLFNYILESKQKTEKHIALLLLMNVTCILVCVWKALRRVSFNPLQGCQASIRCTDRVQWHGHTSPLCNLRISIPL